MIPKGYCIVGYVILSHNKRIVKVKITNNDAQGCFDGYPYIITSLEKNVEFKREIVDLVVVNFYKTREIAEAVVMNNLEDEYLQAKRSLRRLEKEVKAANLRIFEFKKFKRLESVE